MNTDNPTKPQRSVAQVATKRLAWVMTALTGILAMVHISASQANSDKNMAYVMGFSHTPADPSATAPQGAAFVVSAVVTVALWIFATARAK